MKEKYHDNWFFSILMFTASRFLARPLSVMFVGYDEELMAMTLHAFSIFAFSFLFAGFAIFSSAFFTAPGGWNYLRSDLLPENTDLSGFSCTSPAAYLGIERYLVFHRYRGDSGCYCRCSASVRQTEKVSLLITVQAPADRIFSAGA